MSKRLRRIIIEELVNTYSGKGLAELLGVSPAAVSKYLSGVMHPSDKTMIRALSLLKGEQKRKIYQMIVDELANGLYKSVREFHRYIEWSPSLSRTYNALEVLRKTSVIPIKRHIP
ncbi:MAG: helix-turn-helix domain-containing protein [Desulfurococcales archaeon]|nr:helix-turn-helix domain-containing protein [Desulfurococcales archaeon]